MWMFCHRSPGTHLEAFRLLSRGVDKMSQWSKSPRGKLLKVTVASKRAVGSKKELKKHPLYTPSARSGHPESVCGGPKVKGIVSRNCHLSKSAATWTRYRREKWKSEVDKMSHPWVGQNYSGSECHSATKCPFFGVDGQSVHFETECHSRKLSQSRNVSVEKCHMVEVSQ